MTVFYTKWKCVEDATLLIMFDMQIKKNIVKKGGRQKTQLDN